MDLNLRGRKALVTGASKGIGYATARCLAQEGCDVVLVSRTASDLEAARERILKECNVAITVEPRDISDGKNAPALAQKYPDLDILVNNAGAIPGGRLDEIDEARWRAAWDLKVFGYINLTREYFRSDEGARQGCHRQHHRRRRREDEFELYRGLRWERVLDGLHPRARRGGARGGPARRRHQPGPVATDRHVTLMRKQAQDKLGDPERWRELSKNLPFGRAATPEEIAAMAAFLASDLSAYTTGTIITIDGGLAHRGG